MVKTVTIVSLSAGTIGEEFVKHELEIGLRRLHEYGLKVKFGRNALMGIEYLKAHPEERAEDFLEAMGDQETDMILCAIGGDDTYRLLPYLFEHDELRKAAADKSKIFLGFSDSTINHLMLHKVGVNTFYGQSFLSDICEIGGEMLPYTRRYFEELISTGTISRIEPSDIWYECRTDFSQEAVSTSMPGHPDRGFELLQGDGRFSGEILGGCIDTLYDIWSPERYSDSPELCARYDIFPHSEDWRGKILLLETSEEQAELERYRRMLLSLRKTGIFEAVSGVLVGKPMDEKYDSEYREILLDIIGNPALPVVWNINVGHSTPRCIIPFGVPALVDVPAQTIEFKR